MTAIKSSMTERTFIHGEEYRKMREETSKRVRSQLQNLKLVLEKMPDEELWE